MLFQAHQWRSTSIAVAIAAIAGATQVASAVQLADGTVYFVEVPRLLDASTLFDAIRIWGGTYYFKLSIPEGAGEPLQRVVIQQEEGLDEVEFDLDATSAVETDNQKQRLSLGEVRLNPAGGVEINFDPPVPPGKNITIALRPYTNPDVGGVYLFGVTAFPQGEKAHGQFLGFGRLQFFDSSSRSFFPRWWH